MESPCKGCEIKAKHNRIPPPSEPFWAYSRTLNPRLKNKNMPQTKNCPKNNNHLGLSTEPAKNNNHLGHKQDKAGNTEDLFVHQLLAKMGSDGSLALCCWQVADRIRFKHCLSLAATIC